MAAQTTRTIETIKQPYKTSGGETLYLGTSTEVQVDSDGKYIPKSAVVSLRLYTGGILGTDYKTVAIRNAGESWRFTQDGNQNYVAGKDLQQTLANRNSLMNINLNNHVSNALQAPLQGVPAGQVNTNTQSSANAAAGLPPTTGTARPDPPSGTPQQTLQLTPLEDPTIESDYNRKDYSDLVYPTNLRKNKQDFIQFKSYEYGGRGFSPSQTSSGYSLSLGERGLTPRDGSVTLPVQPSISDMNTVQWGSGDLNAIGAYVASTSYGLMGNNPGQAANSSIDEAFRILSNDPNIGKAVKLAAAGRAASVSGLLSRVGGAILNPNIELLFQGPQLRPFNFTFRLSARDGDEAETIKKIIRFFKQNMSVKTTSDNIFLKTPNVFEISYNNGDGDTHTSLNRIKKCALTAFNVDYTPDSQYMTFKDSAKGYPMTSYGLSMQFQELEPVTEKDYEELNENEIGY